MPVPIMLAIEPPCAPPNVNPNPLPVMVPVFEMAIVPEPPMMLLALPSVSKPAYVAPVAEPLITAPPLLMPVPLTVNASALE